MLTSVLYLNVRKHLVRVLNMNHLRLSATYLVFIPNTTGSVKTYLVEQMQNIDTIFSQKISKRIINTFKKHSLANKSVDCVK